MNEELQECKRTIIKDLKKDIVDKYQSGFVDDFENNSKKMQVVNSAIVTVDKEITPYDYDNFCKAVLDIVKNTLEKDINYENLFLSEQQCAEMMMAATNYEDFHEKINKILLSNFHNKLHCVINEKIIINLIKSKVPEDIFSSMEPMLKASCEFSRKLVEKKLNDGSLDDK